MGFFRQPTQYDIERTSLYEQLNTISGPTSWLGGLYVVELYSAYTYFYTHKLTRDFSWSFIDDMLLLLEPVPPFLPDFVLTSTMAKTAYGIYTHAYPSVWEFKVITQSFTTSLDGKVVFSWLWCPANSKIWNTLTCFVKQTELYILSFSLASFD